jgi:hypothetical protein
LTPGATGRYDGRPQKPVANVPFWEVWARSLTVEKWQELIQARTRRSISHSNSNL